VCLFVNSLGRDSAANAVTLVILWVALVVIGPAFANAAASLIYPAPARSELVLAVREASVGAERNLDAAQARFREEHAGTSELRRDDRTARTLEVTVAADARADELLARQETEIHRQRRMAERLSTLLPASLAYDTFAELAGSGHSRWDDYLARVADFHERWREFFVSKARAGVMLTTADYAAFPRFEAVQASPAARRATIQRVAGSLGLIAAMSAVLATLALRRLARTEI
jgi:ABC-2 type transport system permease protein